MDNGNENLVTRQSLAETIGLLRYAHKKATGGMWAQGKFEPTGIYRSNSRNHGRHVASAFREQDALFIVAAHNLLPEVLNALEAALNFIPGD